MVFQKKFYVLFGFRFAIMCSVPGSHLFSCLRKLLSLVETAPFGGGGVGETLDSVSEQKFLHTKIINCDDKWKFIDARISEKLLNFTLY